MPIVAWTVNSPEVEQTPVPEFVIDSLPGVHESLQTPSLIQEIALQLPSDDDHPEAFPQVMLTFNMEIPELATNVAENADLAFIISGTNGLVEFNRALHGTGVALAGTTVEALAPVWTRGDLYYIDDVRTPNRGRLIREYSAYLSALPRRQALAATALRDIAVSAARARLAASKLQVVTEASRYLSTSSDPAAVPAILLGTAPNRLTGPEVLGLVQDLIAIAHARLQLAGAQDGQRRNVQQWDQTKLAMLSDDRSRSGVFRPYLTDQQARQLGQDLAALPDSAEVLAAKQRTADQRLALTNLVISLASKRPLIFRLWNTDAPFIALHLIRDSRTSNTVADRTILADSGPLRDLVLNPLRTAYRAATDLDREFTSNPEIAWKFEPLIDAALTSVHADESDFASRVVHDRIREAKPATELAVVSEWLGYAQMTAVVTGAEPTAVAFMVAQIAVDLTGVIAKAFAVAQQQQGEAAFLNPSDRLGVPPSYSGPVMDAFDIALGVLNPSPVPIDTRLLGLRSQ